MGILLAGVVLSAACGKSSGGGTEKSAATTTPGSTPATTTAVTTPSAQGPNTGGACKLVTSAELEKAAGAPLGTPTPRTFPPDKGLTIEFCQWTNGKQGASTAVYTYSGGITGPLFNQFRQDHQRDDPTTVNGVGDEAFEVMTRPVDSKTNQIYFRKGSKAALVELQVLKDTTDTTLQERVLELSKAAAGRL